MAKTYGGPTNQRLRVVSERLLKERFDNKRGRFARAIGVSPTYVSDFLNEHRGAGLELLVGLSKYAPLDVMAVLEIDIPTVLELAAHGGDRDATGEEEQSMQTLPGPVARAVRAAIELTGCTADEAVKSAFAALEEYGEVPETDADWWLSKIRDRLPKRSKSGLRPSTRIRAADKA